MKEALGFEGPEFKPEESYDQILEMMRLFRGLAKIHIKKNRGGL
jgi:hypothetical protein